ncbi:hypothetical protein [Streptomyces vinaceus]|uniref:hypothetical protein n=1 Tax=Streptomyces vinaceus TaxID=1960 RepID=UPI0035DF29AF
MILILGLIILIAAVVIGLAGIFGNTGPGHGLGAGGDFSIFGYHATGSTGALFLIGIIVGAAALLGLALVMTGVRRSARTRRRMGTSRREAKAIDREHEHAREREELIRQRDDARAETAARNDAPAGTAAPVTDAPPDAPSEAPHGRSRWFGHRTAHR